MKFLKLGKRFINLDLVTDIDLDWGEPGQVRVIAVNGGANFTGQEAAALRHYLDGNCDNVVATYTRYLEHEERVKKANAAEQQFQAFCTDKDLNNEEKYSFRYWLQNDTDESFGWQPGEESFAQWRDWQAGVFEQNIKNAAKSALIPEGRIEEFKEYCKQRGIAQPQYYEGLQFLNQQTKTVPMF